MSSRKRLTWTRLPPRLPARRQPRSRPGPDVGAPSRRRAQSLAGAALAALAACSEAPSTQPMLARLELAPASGAAQVSLQPTLAQHLDVPADLASWSVQAEEQRVVKLPGARAGDPVRALRIVGDGKSRIDITGSFEPATFNQVAVTLTTSEEIELAFSVTVGNNRLRSTPKSRLLAPSKDPQVALFDIPNTRALRQPLTELTLTTTRDHGLWHLLRVDLLSRPIESFLPRGEGGLIEDSLEARRGRGLTSVNPLSCEFDVPAGAELSFGFAWPKELRTPAARPKLVVRIARSDGGAGRGQRAPSEVLGQYPLLRPAVDGVGWHTVRLPLDAYAGQRVSLEFSIVAQSPETTICALTEPRICVPRTQAPAPTVLLVTSDTHRADHVAGAPRAVEISTPALKALAARGVSFDDCLVTINNTIPSHVALLTATHPRDTGVLTNRSSLSEAAPTLAEHFRAAGWVTYAVTSMKNLGHPTTGLGQGFDRLSWPQSGQRCAEDSLAVLERWLPDAEGRPLFVWLHLYDAHHPYEPPAEFAEAYYPADRDPRDPALPERDFPAPYRNHEVRDREWFAAMYRGEVQYVDERLGELLERPRFRAGIVAFTADHGEALGENGIYWDHTGLYTSVVDVPLILAWPDAPGGTRVSTPVLQTDVGRTLLDLVDLSEVPFGGQDLVSELEGGSPERPRFALGAQASCASLSVGGWHAVLHLDRSHRSQYVPDDFFPRHRFELYDIRSDPSCGTDLASAEPERAAKLRQALIEWLTGAVPTGWVLKGTDDPDMIADLAELGYVIDSAPQGRRNYFDPECACDECARYD